MFKAVVESGNSECGEETGRRIVKEFGTWNVNIKGDGIDVYREAQMSWAVIERQSVVTVTGIRRNAMIYFKLSGRSPDDDRAPMLVGHCRHGGDYCVPLVGSRRA